MDANGVRARGVGAVGFIVSRWLLTFCNIPAACDVLASASAGLAGFYVLAFLASPRAVRPAVLGRTGARLLALTCLLYLIDQVLDQTAAEFFWRRTAFGGGLDFLAWVWALGASLAAARWAWGGLPKLAGGVIGRVAPRHLILSGCIGVVLALQVWSLVRTGPAFWPFVDYRLYTTAHGTPIRAVHYQLYGTTAQSPGSEVEIAAETLGMRWFPFHTQFIPVLFDRPERLLDDLHRRLDNSELPPLELVHAERITFELDDDSRLGSVVERRAISTDPDRRESR